MNRFLPPLDYERKIVVLFHLYSGIQVLVQAKTDGFVALGINENNPGNMVGAECVLGYVADSETSAITIYEIDVIKPPPLFPQPITNTL